MPPVLFYFQDRIVYAGTWEEAGWQKVVELGVRAAVRCELVARGSPWSPCQRPT